MHYSFDFDYTLADSASGTSVCASHALTSLGFTPPPDEVIQKTVGLSLPRTFEVLTGINGTDLGIRFKDAFIKKADEVMLDHITFYEDVPGVLKFLKDEQHHVSVVSTKYRSRIEDALNRDGLSDLVDDIVGGDCVINNKPDPEGLLMAISRSGVPKQETIYIGDSVSDGDCAQRAGVAFIATLSGVTPEEELLRWQPLRVIQSVRALTVQQEIQ
jgi:phosphoglycolate phosphatase